MALGVPRRAQQLQCGVLCCAVWCGCVVCCGVLSSHRACVQAQGARRAGGDGTRAGRQVGGPITLRLRGVTQRDAVSQLAEH